MLHFAQEITLPNSIGQRTGELELVVMDVSRISYRSIDVRSLASSISRNWIAGSSNPSPQHLDPTPSLLIMQLEIPIPEVLELLRLASETSPPTKTMLNPAPAVDLPGSTYKLVSHLIVNESEASMLSGRKLDTLSTSLKLDCLDVADFFSSRGVSDSVIITLGGQGAFWYDVKGSTHGLEAAANVKVVDTTAAGDTFVGGYAVSIVSGASVEDAVKWASKSSALTVTRKGAQEAIPWRSDI